jgi:hypothetical protein
VSYLSPGRKPLIDADEHSGVQKNSERSVRKRRSSEASLIERTAQEVVLIPDCHHHVRVQQGSDREGLS